MIPRAAMRHKEQGITMIEVLITIVVVAIGLMGMAVMQMTSMNNQLEAYQRSQALFLIEDMANRIRGNAAAARTGDYANATDFGLQDIEDCDLEVTQAARDLCEWNIAVIGTSTTLDGNNIGSVVGANACLENIAGSADGETIIRLTVAWQGMTPTVSPASDCGRNNYGADDRFRRTVSVDTVLASLAI
ncbi:MAG: type IV pilus modification protein PilV [Halioglobus sp.]|nr:type IV pilus modification protein PilV [Halioglobus sp.]